MAGHGVSFGLSTQAVGAEGLSDHALYEELMSDVALGSSLGYRDVWLIEHHFSDYYPTPKPLLLLSHVAALSMRSTRSSWERCCSYSMGVQSTLKCV